MAKLTHTWLVRLVLIPSRSSGQQPPPPPRHETAQERARERDAERALSHESSRLRRRVVCNALAASAASTGALLPPYSLKSRRSSICLTVAGTVAVAVAVAAVVVIVPFWFLVLFEE